jgi:SAM-dependent methyltransferase
MDHTRLPAAAPPPTRGGITLARRLGRFGVQLATDARIRRAWMLRLSRPENLFQPSTDTWDDRYPDVFSFLRDQLGDDPELSVLSFGCSTGEEVFSLRRYLPSARLRGVDISRMNVATCRRRQARQGDARMEFVRAASVAGEPTAGYDAVLCMAVFRHADLAARPPTSASKIRFHAFESALQGVERCLKPGGYLAMDHSNFRLTDTVVGPRFRCVLERDRVEADARTPVYGPDERLVEPQPARVGVVFQKEPACG